MIAAAGPNTLAHAILPAIPVESAGNEELSILDVHPAFEDSKGPHDCNTHMRLEGWIGRPIPSISNDQGNIELGPAVVRASGGRNSPALRQEKGIGDSKRPVAISACASAPSAKHSRRRHLRPADRLVRLVPAAKAVPSDTTSRAGLILIMETCLTISLAMEAREAVQTFFLSENCIPASMPAANAATDLTYMISNQRAHIAHCFQGGVINIKGEPSVQCYSHHPVGENDQEQP